MIRTCSIFKNIKQCLFRDLRSLRKHTNVLSAINYKFQNHASVISTCKPQFDDSYKYKTNYFLGVSMLTSLWYQTDPKEDIEDNVAHLIALAKIALERGDIERAQDILRLGLKLSEEHKLYHGVPYLYDILATLSLTQGKVKEAEDLIVTAIEKLTIWGFPDDHYNVIDFKLRLARIYSANGNKSFAKLGFQSCLDQQKTKILSGDTSERNGILYVNILFWYGVHMIRNEMYGEARSMINTAYDFSTKIKGLSPKQEMVILYTLSDLNTELGDLEIALTSMLDAIVLGKGIGSVDLPFCYMKLGGIYEKIGFYDQAKFAYEQAMKSANTFGYFEVVADAEDALDDLERMKSNQ